MIYPVFIVFALVLAVSIGLVRRRWRNRSTRERTDQLERDAQEHDGLRTLENADLNAVARLLRDELQAEGRRSFKTDIMMNVAFFVLGIVMSVLLG